jgi:hypothetical protein
LLVSAEDCELRDSVSLSEFDEALRIVVLEYRPFSLVEVPRVVVCKLMGRPREH